MGARMTAQWRSCRQAESGLGSCLTGARDMGCHWLAVTKIGGTIWKSVVAATDCQSHLCPRCCGLTDEQATRRVMAGAEEKAAVVVPWLAVRSPAHGRGDGRNCPKQEYFWPSRRGGDRHIVKVERSSSDLAVTFLAEPPYLIVTTHVLPWHPSIH
jgi:hypothetical protein